MFESHTWLAVALVTWSGRYAVRHQELGVGAWLVHRTVYCTYRTLPSLQRSPTGDSWRGGRRCVSSHYSHQYTTHSTAALHPLNTDSSLQVPKGRMLPPDSRGAVLMDNSPWWLCTSYISFSPRLSFKDVCRANSLGGQSISLQGRRHICFLSSIIKTMCIPQLTLGQVCKQPSCKAGDCLTWGASAIK